MADSFGQQLRSPILHWPSEQDLDYEDVTFPALDGVPLEGWFIPARGSDKLIIANHPMGFSRSGIPAHLEPWKSIWAPSGNDFEVNLVPDYKILHDAGYNVLAYDLRNFGLSGGGQRRHRIQRDLRGPGRRRLAELRAQPPGHPRHDDRPVQPLPGLQFHVRGHDPVPRRHSTGCAAWSDRSRSP